MKQAIISIVALIFFIGCNKSDKKDYVAEKKNCDFHFEINVKGPEAYKFNSQTGRLQKLINPFKDEKLYADTIFFVPKDITCELLRLYNLYELSKYPKDFHPENIIEIKPEPSYYIKFKVEGREKEIDWVKNTMSSHSKEAKQLRKVLHMIDSVILKSPEFKHLPKQEYEWL